MRKKQSISAKDALMMAVCSAFCRCIMYGPGVPTLPDGSGVPTLPDGNNGKRCERFLCEFLRVAVRPDVVEPGGKVLTWTKKHCNFFVYYLRERKNPLHEDEDYAAEVVETIVIYHLPSIKTEDEALHWRACISCLPTNVREGVSAALEAPTLEPWPRGLCLYMGRDDPFAEQRAAVVDAFNGLCSYGTLAGTLMLYEALLVFAKDFSFPPGLLGKVLSPRLGGLHDLVRSALIVDAVDPAPATQVSQVLTRIRCMKVYSEPVLGACFYRRWQKEPKSRPYLQQLLVEYPRAEGILAIVTGMHGGALSVD